MNTLNNEKQNQSNDLDAERSPLPEQIKPLYSYAWINKHQLR